MHPVLIKNLQSLERSNNKKQFLIPRFIKLMLSILCLCIFLSIPHWLPPTISFLKNVEAIAFGPKGLFVVCNMIVVFLVGESKLSKSSMQPDMYQKLYGKRCNDEAYVEVEKMIEEIEEEEVGEEEVEELNKRVEDFIARVNKQRKLEAKLRGYHS